MKYYSSEYSIKCKYDKDTKILFYLNKRALYIYTVFYKCLKYETVL